MLRYRLITGLGMWAGVFALGALDQWVGRGAPAYGLVPGIVMLVALLAAGAMLAWELTGLLTQAGLRPSRLVLTVAVMAGTAAPYVLPLERMTALAGAAAVATTAIGVLVLALLERCRTRTTRGAAGAGAAALLAFVYPGLMLGMLMALRREHSAWVVLAVVTVIKSCDIGAYATGRAIGRHKLIPWLSPGKTWEGLAGGAVLAAVIGLAAVAVLRATGTDEAEMGLGLWKGAAGGMLFAVVGQAGDLMASLLKRDAGLKDSSTAIPGFGGALDVVDSLLLAAPLAYWLLHTA